MMVPGPTAVRKTSSVEAGTHALKCSTISRFSSARTPTTVPITEDFASSPFNEETAKSYAGSLPSSGAPTIDESFAKFFETLDPAP